LGQQTETKNDLRHLLQEGGRPLLLILIVAALIRIGYGTAFFASHPLAETPISDGLLYHEWATEIAGGDWAGNDEPYHHPPLYPYLLGAVYTITGAHPSVIVILQLALGILSTWLGYGFARRVAPRGASLAATALTLLYLPTVLFETRLLPATLATSLSAAALYHLAAPKPDGWTRGVSGLLLGLLAAARPNQLLALLLLAPIAALRDGERFVRAGFLRRFLPIAIGATIAIAPFTARNFIMSGDLVILCDTGGVNLYLSHHPDAAASFRTTDLRFADVRDQPTASKRIAEQAEGRPLSFGEVSSHFTGRAIDFVLQNPLDELRLIGKRLLAVFDSHEYGIVYPPEPERHLSWVSSALFLPFGILAALAVAGAVLSIGRSPTHPGRSFAALFLLAQIATVLLFFQYSRFRVPSIPAVASFVAVAIALAPGWRSLSRRRVAWAAGLAVASLIPSFLPDDSHTREQDAAGHVVLAEAFAAEGKLEDAEAHLALARNLAPDMARGFLAQVHLHRQAGRSDEALALLEELYRTSPGQPLLLEAMIRLLAEDPAVRDPDRAAALSKEALVVGPGLTHVRITVARAAMIRKAYTEAFDAIEPSLRFPDRTAECFFIAGAALFEAGDPAAALPYLLEAADGMEDDPRIASYLWRAYKDTGAGQTVEGQRAAKRLQQLDPLRKLPR